MIDLISTGKKFYAAVLLVVLTMLLVAIEAIDHSRGGIVADDTLFRTHVTCATIWLLLLIVSLIIPTKNEKARTWINYSLIPFCVVAIVTAVPLILRM
jgi:succinate dehydrogenase hydrophobic anchor subunit